MPRLFVIMPFGPRDAEDGVLDFDTIYLGILRPAGEDAGYSVLRIDELPESGFIPQQYLRELALADLAVADISVPNANVYYELGVRQAISTGGTVLVARKGSPLPFDVASQRVFWYQDSTAEQREASRKALGEIIRQHVVTENQIRAFLEEIGIAANPNADAAAFEHELQGRIDRARTLDQLIAVWKWAENLAPLPASPLLSLAEKLAENATWDVSVQVLRAAAAARPRDYEIHRMLGFHLRHMNDEDGAFESLSTARELNPNDPETLGMLGGLLKHRGLFEEAKRLYDEGAALVPSNDYMRVNQAALWVLAAPHEPSKGVALYGQLLAKIERDRASHADLWTNLVAGEAAFAVGRGDAEAFFDRAAKLATARKPLRSAAEQLELFAKVGFRPEEALRLAERLRSSEEPVIAVSEAAPSPSDAAVAQAELPVILHLSDPHFGSMVKDGKEVEMHRFFDGDYSAPLSVNLRNEFKAKHAYFQYDARRLILVISGDLTYRAQKEEFNRVKAFLQELCADLDIPPERVVLVPGNHDIHWPSIELDKTRRFDNYLSFLRSFYGEPLFRKLYPRVTWDFQVDTDRPKPEDIISIHSGDVTIVGMNSCVYETNQDHYGFIGGRQLKAVESLLDDVQSRIRIAVFHHHIHPFPEPVADTAGVQPWLDTSTLRDAGLVERTLEKLEFDVLLHGHKHKPQFRETLVRSRNERGVTRSPLIVCGGGSVGVSRRELEHGSSNQYGVIEFLHPKRMRGVSFLRLEWRELSFAPGSEWATSEQWNVQG